MTDRYHQPQIECMPLEDLRALQSRRLRTVLDHVWDANPLYRTHLGQSGYQPGDVRTPEDLPLLPTMSKQEFRDHYPLGLLCVDRSRVRDMHMSSGSTGAPVVMPYTDGDIDQWAECMARCYLMAHAAKGDVVQITPSFGLFNGGFGFYHGARAAGLFVLPTGSGNTARQIKLARDFRTRVLTGVVSYGVRIMEMLAEMNTTLPDLEVGLFGSETFSDAMKRKLADGLNIEVFDIYGMTETGGVGTLGMDCHAHDGIHVWEDHYIVEILPRGGNTPVPDGELGELTITALTREALPVIRFRTGDLTRIVSREPCACGRTHVRIAPITGRVDDMLIIKGVNFFPKQVEQALMEIPGVGANYQIIIEETNGVRDVRINVEAELGVTGFMVAKHLKEVLGFTPQGDVFAIGDLPRQEGKAKRVFFENHES